MLRRLAENVLRERLTQSPAVALLGPRQVGKTTLARALSPQYYDLEQPSERLRLDLTWDSVVTSPDLVVLDEAQASPDVFPRLRGAIDADRARNCRFLLLGSVSPGLMEQVSESLAGRLALVELSPLVCQEVSKQPVADLWLRGGFPGGGILDPAQFPRWQRDYLTLQAERDLPAWGLHASAQTAQRLFRMLAALHGQLWNASQLGQSLGLSYHTVNAYVDVLEGAYLVRRLLPWLPNLKKRLQRSPRVFWRDTGLLHALLGAASMDELLAQPWVGASWEGFVIQQVVDTLSAHGSPIEPHFFRTSDGFEIDLVFRLGAHTWAIEAKLTSSPSQADFARFERACDLAGADRRYLVAHVAESVLGSDKGVVTLPRLLELLIQP